MTDSTTTGTRERITGDPGGDFERCICGNTPHSAGFYPSDRDGYNVEPDAAWAAAGHVYRCDDCGRLIDGATLEVVGRVDPDDHGPGCDGPLNCTCDRPAPTPPPVAATTGRVGPSRYSSEYHRGGDYGMFGGDY